MGGGEGLRVGSRRGEKMGKDGKVQEGLNLQGL